jgi:hypothetical protein
MCAAWHDCGRWGRKESRRVVPVQSHDGYEYSHRGVGCMHVDMWFLFVCFFGSGGTVSDDVVHGNTVTDRMQGRVAQHP